MNRIDYEKIVNVVDKTPALKGASQAFIEAIKTSDNATTGDVILYVDGENGKDTNDASIRKPVKTIEEALNRIPDIVKHKVTINVAPGMYYTQVSISNTVLGEGKIIIEGQGDAPVDTPFEGYPNNWDGGNTYATVLSALNLAGTTIVLDKTDCGYSMSNGDANGGHVMFGKARTGDLAGVKFPILDQGNYYYPDPSGSDNYLAAVNGNKLIGHVVDFIRPAVTLHAKGINEPVFKFNGFSSSSKSIEIRNLNMLIGDYGVVLENGAKAWFKNCSAMPYSGGVIDIFHMRSASGQLGLEGCFLTAGASAVVGVVRGGYVDIISCGTGYSMNSYTVRCDSGYTTVNLSGSVDLPGLTTSNNAYVSVFGGFVDITCQYNALTAWNYIAEGNPGSDFNLRVGNSWAYGFMGFNNIIKGGCNGRIDVKPMPIVGCSNLFKNFNSDLQIRYVNTYALGVDEQSTLLADLNGGNTDITIKTPANITGASENLGVRIRGNLDGTLPSAFVIPFDWFANATVPFWISTPAMVYRSVDGVLHDVSEYNLGGKMGNLEIPLWEPNKTLTNDAIYFGGTEVPNRGIIKMNTQPNQSVPYVWEYWNGSAWVQFQHVEDPAEDALNTFGKYLKWDALGVVTSLGDGGIGLPINYWIRARAITEPSATVTNRSTIRYVYTSGAPQSIKFPGVTIRYGS